MDFVPAENDTLYAIVHDLVLGPTGAVAVTARPTAALLRTADQSAHMLLVRNDVDLGWVAASMKQLRESGLDVLLVGGSHADRQRLVRVRPGFTGRGIRILHLCEGGSLWVEPVRLGGYKGPLARYLEGGGRGSASPDWERLRQRVSEQTALAAQQAGAYAQSLADHWPVASVLLAAAIGVVVVLQLGFRATRGTGGLVRMGALVPQRVLETGEVWRLFSCTFLHLGLEHAAGNLAVLLALGLRFERVIGSARFLLVYSGAAVVGSLASLAFMNATSVGASGALWGVMAAQFVLAWRSRDVLPQPVQKALFRFAGLNLVGNLMNSFWPGIDWAAHLGGGAAGGLIMLALVATLPRLPVPGVTAPTETVRTDRSPLWLRALAGLAVVGMAAGLGMALVRGRFWEFARPPRYQRVELAGVHLSLELPEQLRDRRTGQESGEFFLQCGDILQDPVALRVGVKPLTAPGLLPDAVCLQVKVELDRLPTPPEAESLGPASERLVAGRCLIEKRYRFGNGGTFRVTSEITPTQVRSVGCTQQPGIDGAWAALGEHVLLSIESPEVDSTSSLTHEASLAQIRTVGLVQQPGSDGGAQTAVREQALPPSQPPERPPGAAGVPPPFPMDAPWRLPPDIAGLPPYLLRDSAWFLATCAPDEIRDGKKASEHARKACELTGWQDASCLEAMAAACAEVGQYEEAVKWQRKALADASYAAQYGEPARARLALYQAGKPYRQDGQGSLPGVGPGPGAGGFTPGWVTPRPPALAGTPTPEEAQVALGQAEPGPPTPPAGPSAPGSAPGTGPQALSVGLVLHYTFEGQDRPEADATPARYAAKVHGAPKLVPGKVGTALEFDGVDDYLEAKPLRLGGALSVAAWVKYRRFNSWSRIIDFGQGPNAHNIILANVRDTAGLQWAVFNGDGTRWDQLTVPDFWTPGEWVHVVVTVDDRGSLAAFRNGMLVQRKAGSPPKRMLRESRLVGRSNWAVDGLFQGVLDELMIYDRALSPDEAKALYDGALPGPGAR